MNRLGLHRALDNTGRKKLSGPAARSYRFWGPLGTIWDPWGPSGDLWDHHGTIWEMDSMKLSVSLRIRTFRSARIDPTSLPKHRRTNFKKSCHKINSNMKKESKKTQKTAENRHSIKIPYRSIPHSYPLKGAAIYRLTPITCKLA